MARLYSEAKTVEQLTGLSLKGTMLTPTQYHDRRHVLPFVLASDRGEHLLVRQIDSGNLEGCGFRRLPILRFAPYWLPKPDPGVHETVADAVRSVTGGERLTVDAFMPVSVYEQLRNAMPVEVSREAAGPVEAFRFTPAQVLGRFNHHRSDLVRVARKLTEGHPQAERLERWYAEQSFDAYALLDQMAQAAGLSTLLATWVTDFQELSGLPGTLAEDFGYAALYLAGSGEFWVLAPAGLGAARATPNKRYPSLAQAVKELAGSGTVGIGVDTLGASRWLDLQDQGLKLADGGQLLRDWREEKTGCDIPYFVVGAMASRYAIDGAADFARLAIRGGVEITEKDVDRVYLSRLEEFRALHQLPVKFAFYFTNNHAGARTIYPSRPTNYKLSGGMTSLKIDAGIFLFDDGLFHACTDIARTVTTTEAADEVFDAMERVMLEETIPGILPGMSGEEIHRMGTGQMAAKEAVFRQHGYLPDDFSWSRSYPRDIGHVIERQESNTFGFKPGIARPVHAGMVGCIEYHCAYDRHALTCEDTFVIDEEGAIVISRGPEEFGADGKVTRRR
jgi:Xaa-Pro aminopeptidase